MILIAGALSLAAALFAVGAAVSSDEDTPSVAPAPASTQGTDVDGTSAGAGTETTSAAAAAGQSTAAAGSEIAVEIVDFAFGPGELTVPAGSTVVWRNNDGFDHTIAFADDVFPESPVMAQGDTFAMTFAEPGTYAYVCGIHPRMTGSIVVEG